MKKNIPQFIVRSLLLFAVIFFFAGMLPASGQDFPILHYGLEDGLPSNKIYDIYRDSRGCLWIASDKGVGRYNGIKFEKFTTFDGLADNEVFFFKEDYYGRIWLASYGGELCYYKDGIFHNAKNTPFLQISPRPHSFIANINVEKDSSVTIQFSNQTLFINVSRDKTEFHDFGNARNDKVIYKIKKEKKREGVQTPYNSIIDIRKTDDGYKVFCHDSIVFLNKKDEIIKYGYLAPGRHFQNSFSQNKNYYYSDLWVFDNEKLRPLMKFDSRFYNLYNLYMHNLRRVYSNNAQFFLIVPSGIYKGDTDLFFKGNFSSVTQDNTGNYWIGSMNNGIICMPRSFDSCHFLKDIYRGEIKYCAVKNGILFYATADGKVYCIENKKASCVFDNRKYYNDKGNVYPDAPGYMIDSNRLFCFYGHSPKVVNNFLDKNQTVNRYFTNQITDNIKGVFSSKGDIYIRDMYWIFRFDYDRLKPDEEVCHHSFIFNYDYRIRDRIFYSAQAADESIWYTTIDKMYKISGDSSVEQKQFRNVHFNTFSFCGQYVIGYTHENQLLVCFADQNNGALQIDSVSNQNCIWYKIYKIDSTHLLLSTDNKYRIITVYPPNSSVRYDIRAVENPFVPLLPEAICADSNSCYFFKNGNITSIDVRMLLQKQPPPNLYFTTLKLGRQKVHADSEYTIPYSLSRNLILSFSTVSFGGKDVSYQYSVSKNDKENWNNIASEEINLINSGYGDYMIKVRAKTLSSEYSTPIVFTLHILRPYWATWWFISLTVLVLGSIVFLIVRQRVKAVVDKREKEHDNEVRFMRSEYKALNALMNPHFIFNTLNNVQSLVNGNNKLAANEYLRIFADLVRQNMHNVSKELIPLQKEVDLVRNYLLLEKLRFEDKLNYTIDIDPTLELYDVMVSPLLIQPLVENSIKHGILPLKDRVGVIKINIYDKDGMLYIEIRDNGVGLNNAKAKEGSLHESYGLSNIKTRIEQLSVIQGKEMTFNMGEQTDKEGIKWTTVTVTMML